MRPVVYPTNVLVRSIEDTAAKRESGRTEESWFLTSSGFSSCAKMFFANTFPSSTPIWSTSTEPRSAQAQAQKTNDEKALTERVDTPDNTLREDLVLIQRNQRTQRCRVQNREQNTVARPVSREHLALHQRLARVRAQLLADLLLRLAECERLGLSEEVGEEDAVVLGVGDGVVSRGGGEEVGGDELCALVHELVERVLAVGTCCTPDDRLLTSLISLSKGKRYV